jgi:small subunit ribosomal protein S9
MAIKKIKKIKELEKKPLPAKKIKEEKLSEEKTEPKARFFYAVGRRKSSVAQVRIFKKEKASEDDFLVNGKKAKDYFPTVSLQNVIFYPFKSVGLQGKMGFSIIARGGGVKGQCEAIRLGISRALVIYDENLRKALKDLGFLTRDSRKVERKKPGLKKARRAPQWQKR